MKKNRFILTILLLTNFVGNSLSQNEDALDFLTGTYFNGNILLNWSITQGNTCNGIDILHSYDSISFSQIGNIEGICGSTTETKYYDITHSDVVENATHYYKLQLGGLGFSWTIQVDVYDYGDNNYRLGPNPLGESSKLQVENENHVMLTLTIVDLQGAKLGTSKTSDNFFTLSRQDYPIGKYLFVISQNGGGQDIKGEFVVE